MPDADPVHKISIIARGRMGGYTRYLPTEDRTLWTSKQFKAHLANAMGGYVAERLVFGDVSTGPSNDLEQATHMARSMVTTYGMSERLGAINLGRRGTEVFLGRELGESHEYGEKVADQIDQEVQVILREAENKADEILTQNRAKLDQIAKYLIAHETVEGEKLKALFEGPVTKEDEVAETVPPDEKLPSSG